MVPNTTEIELSPVFAILFLAILGYMIMGTGDSPFIILLLTSIFSSL